MRAIECVHALALAGSLIVISCYRDGERLDVDLAGLERAQLVASSGRFEVWVARRASDRRRGLAVVEPDRLEALPDGRFRGLLQVLPRDAGRAADLVFPFRMVPMDVAALGRDGRVRHLWRLPGPVPRVPDAHYVLEAPTGSFAAAGVELGSWIQGLPAAD